MSKPLNQAQQGELGELHRSVLLILDVLASNGLEARQVEQKRKIANAAYAQKMLNGLRTFRADLNESVRELPQQAQEQLRGLLQQSGCETAEIARAKELLAIEEILRRGKVLTDDEYALILGRVEEIYSAREMAEEVIRLNALLTEYHPRR